VCDATPLAVKARKGPAPSVEPAGASLRFEACLSCVRLARLQERAPICVSSRGGGSSGGSRRASGSADSSTNRRASQKKKPKGQRSPWSNRSSRRWRKRRHQSAQQLQLQSLRTSHTSFIAVSLSECCAHPTVAKLTMPGKA
jgi:hypothetical protein